MASRKIIVYIDGLNLYYGLLAGTPYRWLDLETLFDRALPDDEVTKIRYFTSQIGSDPQAQSRQRSYLEALRSLPRVEVSVSPSGRGSARVPASGLPLLRRRVGHARRYVNVQTKKQKGAVVDLGAHLVFDVSRSAADLYVIVSNDSALAGPMKLAASLGAQVAVVFPHSRPNVSLAVEAEELVPPITEASLGRSQLPPKLQVGGRVVIRPKQWGPPEEDS